MAGITVALVQELRERTGAGIMECKKTLIKAQGNIELAIDIMRKSGQAIAAKKASRIAKEGLILIKISQDCTFGAMIELNCETDFVSLDRDFKTFGEAIISTALHERFHEIEKLKDKFEAQRVALIAKTGENINIRRLGVLEDKMISSYLHGIRIGVMVSATTASKELMKDIAMHIAANKPEYLNTNEIPDEIIARERKIQLDIAMQSGKSRDIIERMVEGRMNKFINEISLMDQHFLMDSSKVVSQVLNEKNTKINNFIRFEVGENINKSEK